MKREYWIGGIFILIFLGFMIGVTVLGSKPVLMTPTNSLISDSSMLIQEPTPTAIPYIFEDNIATVTEPISESTIPHDSFLDQVSSTWTGEYWIAGYCTTEDGTPLDGNRIDVFVNTDELKESWYTGEKVDNLAGESTTDATGYYRVPLKEPNRYQIRSTPPENYLTLWENITLSPNESTKTHHFVHPYAGFQVRGKVIDAQTKAPIAGAEVHIGPKGEDNHIQQQPEEAVSGSDGRFVIHRLAKGTFVLFAFADGYIDTRPRTSLEMKENPLWNVDVNSSTQDKEYIIEMQAGGDAIFHVVNGRGESIANAKIAISRNNQDFQFVHTEITDQNGDAKTSELPFERLIAQASHQQYGTAYSEPFEPGAKFNPTRITITLDGSASVSGHVTNAKGIAIPDREITAQFVSIEQWNQFPGQQAKTDVNGYYHFDHLSAGTYRIIYSGRETRSISYQRREIELKAGDHQIVDFQLGETKELRGKVVTKSESKPVKEARVSACVYLKNNIVGVEKTETDEQGEFTIPFAPVGDTIQFCIYATGYTLTIHDRTMDGSYYILTLDESGSVRGMVLSTENQPVAGAKVWPVRYFSGGRSPSDYQTVISQEDGTFEYANLYPMDYRFRASAQGYTDSESPIISVHQGENLDSILIQMKEGVTVQGRILDPLGQPLPNAVISIYSYITNIYRNRWSTYFSETNFPVSAVSNADGSFQIEQFPSTGDEVIVRHENYAPTRYKIVPSVVVEGVESEPQIHTIQMSVGGSITGTVRNKQNQPMKSVELQSQNFPENLYRHQTFTDENGEYRFEKLPAIPFQILKALQDGEKPGDEYKTIQVINGQEVRCDFGGGEGATVYGCVFKGKDPYPNVTVVLDGTSFWDVENEGIGSYFITTTDEQGNYAFAAVPEGQYQLLASTKVTGAIHDFSSDYSVTLTITEDQSEYLQDIFLGIFTITGTVVDADSHLPLSNVTIRPSDTAGFPANHQLRTTTGEDGVFTLQPQDPGTYSLSAIKDGYETREFQVTIEPDGQSTTYVVNVEMNLIQDDMILIAHLIFDGEAASTSWAHFTCEPQPFSGMLVNSNLPEPGGYRVTGMPEGEIEISVYAYCNGKGRHSFPQRVFMQKDIVSEMTMNIFESRSYYIILKTPENQIIASNSLVYEILDMPGESFRKELTSQGGGTAEGGGHFYADLPVRPYRVRVTVPGFHPVEFVPESVEQVGESSNSYTITLSLLPQ